MTKAQRRRALQLTRYDRRWWSMWYKDIPHHARVLQVGPTPPIVTGRGGRRQRKRRRSCDRVGFLVWLRMQRKMRGPEYPFGDENDIPF